MSDLNTRILALVEQRRIHAGIRDEAQKEYDRLSAEIGVALVSEGITDLTVGDYAVSVREQGRSTISKDLLVELGVGTDVIQQATKESRYTVVHVRTVNKKQDVAA